jgi:hypothetical protein
MVRHSIPLALAAFAVAALASAPAMAQVKTGTLVCDVSAGIGLIIASKKAVVCTFSATDGHTEIYDGYMTKLGIDIGMTTGGTIVWAVFEPGSHGASLGGTYAGATAQATLVAGLGANVLIGGSSQSVALQPLSVSGQTGLNIAAGIGALTLQPAK